MRGGCFCCGGLLLLVVVVLFTQLFILLYSFVPIAPVDMSEPEWLSASEKTSTQEGTPTTAAANSSASEDVPFKALVQGAFSFMLLGTAILMAFTGFKAIVDVDDADDAGSLFIGLYMFLFAVILFVYEVICIKSVDVLENFYAKNFGFLNGPVGKGLYLLL